MTVSDDMNHDLEAVSRKIAKLRADGERVPTALFGWEPTLESAEAVQASMSQEAAKLRSWKVAKSPAGAAVTSALSPLCTGQQTLPWRPGTALEIEVAVRLKADLPVRISQPYTRNDVLSAIGVFHLGAELVRSVLLENGKVSFLAFLADRMGNDGYYVGPEFPGERVAEVQASELKIISNGNVIFDNKARHSNGDCLGWLVDYANRTDRPLGSLASGDFITTGSLCGAIELVEQGTVAVSLGNGLHFQFEVAAIEDRR